MHLSVAHPLVDGKKISIENGYIFDLVMKSSMSQTVDITVNSELYQMVESPPKMSPELAARMNGCIIEITCINNDTIRFYPNGDIMQKVGNATKVWHPKPTLAEAVVHGNKNFGGVYFEFQTNGNLISRVRADNTYYWWGTCDIPPVVYGLESNWVLIDDLMDDLTDELTNTM